GISSSCYGPEEAYLQLGSHQYLAVYLMVAMVATILVISASYSQIIEQFPSGGGGYLVATKLLGPVPGVVSGCALIVDYVLTIAISIASAMDAIFRFMPHALLHCNFMAALFCPFLLIVISFRGVSAWVVVLSFI